MEMHGFAVSEKMLIECLQHVTGLRDILHIRIYSEALVSLSRILILNQLSFKYPADFSTGTKLT